MSTIKYHECAGSIPFWLFWYMMIRMRTNPLLTRRRRALALEDAEQVHVRLERSDVDWIWEQANAHGQSFSTCMRMLIQEARRGREQRAA
jgi:hypothetical protein